MHQASNLDILAKYLALLKNHIALKNTMHGSNIKTKFSKL
jgi:hypothetical protein